MHLERIKEENMLKLTLSLKDLGRLTTKRYLIVEDCGGNGYVPDQLTVVTYQRQRRLARPTVYSDGRHLAVLLPDLFFPVVIRGVRDNDERLVDTRMLTVVDLDRTELGD